MSEDALYRHRNDYLPETLIRAQKGQAQEDALDIVEELRLANRVAKHFLAQAMGQPSVFEAGTTPTQLQTRVTPNADLSLRALDRLHRQIELGLRIREIAIMGELAEVERAVAELQEAMND